MKKLIIMAAAVAVSLSSCSKNEVLLNQSAENAVSFSTYTGISTKGTVTTSTTLTDGFGVLAYDHGSLGSFSDTSIPNFMYNTEVADADGSWAYSPLKYWSSDDYNYYSFFAYAPYDSDVTDGSIALSGADAKGAPTATFTLATDVEDMVDFVAGQSIDRANDRETVELYMKHQLTRVTFSAQSSIESDEENVDNPHYVNVKSIRLLGSAPVSPIDIETVTEVTSTDDYDKIIGEKYYKVTTIEAGEDYNTNFFGSNALYASATYTFNTTATTDDDETKHTQDGTWAAASALSTDIDASDLLATTAGFADDEDITYAVDGVLIQDEATTLFTEDEYLFLIPPVYATTDVYTTGIGTGATDALNNIQVEVIYDIITVDDQLAAGYVASSENSIAIVEIPAGTLVQGFAYNFVLTINGKSYTDPTADVPDDEEPDTEDAFIPVEISGYVLDWDTTEETDEGNAITVQETSAE